MPVPPPLYDLTYATYWTRLICSARDPSLAIGQQVPVHDPLWFLARQWQVGELTGFDGGSPVNATYNLAQTPLNGYQPFTASSPEAITPAGPPLEVLAEREIVQLGLRGSLQLGLRFEAMLAATVPAVTLPATITWYRNNFGVAAAPPPDEIPDPVAVALRAASAVGTGGYSCRATDGWALYQSLLGAPAPSTSPPAAASEAVDLFTTYCQGLYSTPRNDGAWNVTDLRYEFTTTAAPPSNPTVTLSTNDYEGGTLDWYDFDYSSDQATGLVPEASVSVIPHHIWFPGMPTNQWWQFEDGATDLGALDTQLVDLTKMLMSEFAAVCANDWFEFTISAPLGTLNRIATLVVTDTFGTQTLLPPASEAPAANPASSGTGSSSAGPTKPWRMFTLTTLPSDPSTTQDTLLLPPVLSRVEDGPALENVVFLRDDMSAMCWAVEDTLIGPLDNARSGFESQLGAQPAPPVLPEGVDVNYLIGSTVPANWIPLLPFEAATADPTYAAGSLLFRRGAMLAANTDGTPTPVKPRGAILTPQLMLIMRDQAVPRTGVQVNRYFRRARWTDGSVYCWMASTVRPGTKYGYSGLAFDTLETPAPATTSQ